MNEVRKELMEEANNLIRRLAENIRYENFKDAKSSIKMLQEPEFKQYPFFSINAPVDGYLFSEPDYVVTLAAKHGDADFLKTVVDAGADVQLKGPHGDAFSELIRRSVYGSKEEQNEWKNQKLEMVNILLDAGYDIEAKDMFGNTAIQQVVNENDVRLFDAIMERGPNVNSEDNHKTTALSDAVSRRDLYKVTKLIEAGAKPRKGNKNRHAEITLTAIQDNYAIAKILIEAGADVNPTGRYADSPLYFVRSKAKLNHGFEELLIKNGAREESKFEAKMRVISGKFNEMALKADEKREQKKEAKLQANAAIRKIKGLDM